MSLPRQVLPGRVYMITRRCTQRMFLMRPDDATNNAFIYCLGEAAQRFGIEVLFTLAMSNHHHTGIRDPNGNYPLFIERFHKLFAKCQNALIGRGENFWSSEQTSVVRLVDKNDILAKMAYALANPVKDHLVARADQWPGANSLAAITHGKPLHAKRPRYFFRDDGPMPPTVRLELARPPGFTELSPTEFATLVRDQVRLVEKAAEAERARTGRRVLGREAILAQRRSDSPRTPRRRGHIKPRIAARSKWSRIEALNRDRQFLDAYIPARILFKGGVRETIFPQGTWCLRSFTAPPVQPTAPS